jgi:predicted dehydrogenase
MLAEKDLDLVIVATPDHWHALPAIEAMRAGADLYLQKPISADVVEGQAILAAARKYKRVVQVGTQRRSTPHLIHARDRIIREGRLGTVAFAEIYCYYPMRPGKDQPDTAPPAHLDYEMWTGPAPMRPFNPQVHPRGWRAFMEYGNGVVGDMCIHMLDAVRWLLDLGMPTRISSTGGILVDRERRSNISDTQTAAFDFPGLKVAWTHRTWGEPPDPKYPWGLTLYGDKGTLKASVFSWDFTPLGQGQPVHEDVAYEFDQFPGDRTEKDLERHVAPAIRGHMKDLLACMATRGRPVADVEEGYMSTTACILANVSMQAGRSITWDHSAGRAVGDDEVNQLLRRPYRAPWTHPEVAAV